MSITKLELATLSAATNRTEPVVHIGFIALKILQYGMIDGEHHKQWLLDQVLREALGEDGYKAVMDVYNSEPEEYDDWNTGIAP